MRENYSDPIHEYREINEAALTEKLKQKLTSEYMLDEKLPEKTLEKIYEKTSEKTSEKTLERIAERSKHKKRSRSKTRKRSLSKSRKHNHDSSEPKRRKSESSISHQPVHNGKDLGYETPKKKEHLSRSCSSDEKISVKSEKKRKHSSHRPPATTNNSANVYIVSTANNSCPQTPTKTDTIIEKVHMTSKTSSTKSMDTPTSKKHHKKPEVKAAGTVNLLDKIMRDMDGKNWS